MLGLDKIAWYNYSCRSCGFKTEVEDIVVDGFGPSGSSDTPELLCPKCHGTLRHDEVKPPPEGR